MKNREQEKPIRKSIYIFPAQLSLLEKIAKEKKIRLRHIFFDCFQFYIGSYLSIKEKIQNAQKGK